MASSVRSRAKKEPSPELEVYRGFVGKRHGLVSGLGQGVVRDMVRCFPGCAEIDQTMVNDFGIRQE